MGICSGAGVYGRRRRVGALWYVLGVLLGIGSGLGGGVCGGAGFWMEVGQACEETPEMD
jgi:hypothetical protein